MSKTFQYFLSVDPSHNCYNNSGADYLGMVNVTVFRNVCISWSIHRPSTGWKHNFCRNPDKDAHSPWCYVSVKGRREYCAVKKCEFPTKGKDNIQFQSYLSSKYFPIFPLYWRQ
jgi:hypothetical protein